MSVSAVYTDLSEYSRYHQHLSVITTTIEVDSPTPGDVITASLFRLDGYGVVVSKEVTLTTETSYTVTFNLNTDGYVAITDRGGVEASQGGTIYMCRQGDYTVQVSDSDGNVTSSDMFAISIVPVWEIRNEWAKGVTFYSYEVLEPRVQPKNITGVCVSEVSADHGKGPFTLSFTAGSPSSLSWNGGPSVNINGMAPQDLLLLTDSSATADFIMVNVNPLLLPTQNATDVLYIDNGRIKDRAIIDQVRRATSWVEQEIVTKIEPTIIDTDAPANGYADEVGIPDTYIKPSTFNKWMNIQLPLVNILDLEMTAYFNTNLVATIPRQWMVWDERSGIVELVPSTSSEVIWQWYASIFVMEMLFNTNSIPNFWHYRATCGLRDLWGNRGVVRMAVAMATCVSLLNSAGSAYRAGYASQSTSRDGVSQAEGYTSSSMYGTFGSHFLQYQNWLKENLPKMRVRFCGIQFRTI